VYVGAGVVAVLIAAIAGWFLAGSQPGEAHPGAQGSAPATPAVSGQPQASAPVAGNGQTRPATTGVPVRPPLVGVGPSARPAAPGGSANTSSSAGGSGSSEAPAGTDSPDVTDAPVGTRLTSPGGAVYATCESGKAKLTKWEPADGYSVEKVSAGPGLTASIVFAGPSKYRITVTCATGTPTPVVLPL
jgi:serine/threonine-protein kinase